MYETSQRTQQLIFLSLLNLDTVLKDSTPKKNLPAFDNIDQG